MDKAGNLLAHPDLKLRMRNLRNIEELKPLAESIQSIKNGMTDYTFNHVQKVTAFKLVNRSQWIIGVTVNKASILSSINQLIAQFILIFIGLTTLSVGVAYQVSGLLVKRIVHLEQATKRIALGDFSQTIESHGKDEIASLSWSITHMRDSIQEAIQTLDDNNKRLEERVALAVQDITEKNIQLLEAEKISEQNYLVRGVAHELNTPLGNCILVASYVQQQLMGLSDKFERSQLKMSDIQRFLEEMNQSLESINHNLEQCRITVTDYKTLSVDSVELSSNQVDLEEILMRAYHQLELAAQFHLELKLNIEPSLCITSDSLRLYKLFCEIFENAYAHGFDGRANGKIEVTAFWDANLNGAKILIGDNGLGMDESIKSKVFTPFFSTKFSNKHRGLGLNVAYNIVKSLNGDIKIAASELGGTQVELFIRQTEATKQGGA